MIIELDNTKLKIGNQIRALFQVSYKVEAALLKAEYFPPLKRPLEDFLNCKNTFYGYEKSEEIVAVAELKYSNENCHLQSLVVHPNQFRKGIGKKLVQFIIQKAKVKTITVETGFDNFPACELYKSLGFKVNGAYDTEFNIRKIKFILLKEIQ